MRDITSVKEGPACCRISLESYQLIRRGCHPFHRRAVDRHHSHSRDVSRCDRPARGTPSGGHRDGLRTARSGAALAGVGVATAEPAAASAPPASSFGSGMDGMQNRSRAILLTRSDDTATHAMFLYSLEQCRIITCVCVRVGGILHEV